MSPDALIYLHVWLTMQLAMTMSFVRLESPKGTIKFVVAYQKGQYKIACNDQ